MISLSIRKPGAYTDIDDTGASNSLPSTRQNLLIIAPRLSSGAVAANVPVAISSPAQAAANWGAGSIMHRMALAAFEQYPYAAVTGCAVDDAGGGVAAAATVTLSGTATGAGTLLCEIGLDTVSIAIASGDTAVAVATNLLAELAKYAALPITATRNQAVLTLTAKNKGTVGNLIGKYNGTSHNHEPIVTITAAGITAVVAGFTGGATDPTLTAALDAISSYRYHLIAMPWITDAMFDTLATHIDTVSDSINQRGARGYTFVTSAYADATTLSGNNKSRMHVGYIYAVKRSSFELAAAFAALQASQEIPWRSLNYAPLVGCDAPDVQDRQDWTDFNGMLYAGITPFEVGAGEVVRCVRAISTYTTNVASAPDQTWLDSFKIATADYVRDAIIAAHRRNYSNSVLRDNHVDGEPEYVVTPADIRSCNINVCKRIELAGGLQNVDKYKDDFVSAKNPDVAGRVDSQIPIDIVDATHILATTLKIVSSVG